MVAVVVKVDQRRPQARRRGQVGVADDANRDDVPSCIEGVVDPQDRRSLPAQTAPGAPGRVGPDGQDLAENDIDVS